MNHPGRLQMKTHSNDHTMTTTTKTTAAVMMAMCGTFSRRAHSFWRPLGFLLVFLYFLQSFRRVWSTVATSTDTSATCSEQKEELEEGVWRGCRCKILFFDSGVDQFGGAITGVDWRRMKNSSSNSIRSSTHHSSSYRGNIYYSLCHPIRIYRLDHRFCIKWGWLNV